MKGIRRILGLVLLGALLATNVAPAQSQNAQAVDWLNLGLAEKEPQKKISAYQKALAADSLFVEAMYNLGLAYRSQQDYRSAVRWFNKASAVKRSSLTPELKTQILYELGRMHKTLGNLPASAEAFKNANASTSDRKMRIKILFEYGRVQYDQGNLEEALAALRGGEKLDRESAANFQAFIKIIETKQETAQLYEAAEKALAGGKLIEARYYLEQVQKKNPEAPNLAARFARLDSLSADEVDQKALAGLYTQAQNDAAAGNLEAAALAYESLLQRAENYKDARSKLEEARQQLAQKQTQVQLEENYTAGLAAGREGNWTLAILAFEKVVTVDANFRDARRRLDEAQRALDNESTETIMARYYAEGVAALNRNDLGNALAALEKVRRLNAGYRNVAGLLEEVDQRLRQKPKSSAATAAATAQLEDLYQEALAAREKNDWLPAMIALEKVQLLQPHYRDAAILLGEARANLHHAQPSVTPSESDSASPFLWGGAFVAILALPLGLVAFSPSARARLHLLRGNLAGAAQLYEQILKRHPNRVKFYPQLANIYLLMGRNDEQALRIYKAVLNLNLAAQKREEINAIVAQNYLAEGRVDSDAINVFENALKSERHRQNF